VSVVEEEVSRGTIPTQHLGRPQPLNGVVGEVSRSAEDIADWAEGPAVGIEDPQMPSRFRYANKSKEAPWESSFRVPEEDVDSDQKLGDGFSDMGGFIDAALDTSDSGGGVPFAERLRKHGRFWDQEVKPAPVEGIYTFSV